MNALAHRALRFLTDEDGPTPVEYAVMLSLILMVILGTVVVYGDSLREMFVYIRDELPSEAGG